jgi:hypothetical protein
MENRKKFIFHPNVGWKANGRKEEDERNRFIFNGDKVSCVRLRCTREK